MNSQQLQIAIDKYLEIMVEKGTSLKHYHPFFYEKISEVTLKLLHIQAKRAEFLIKPTIELKEKNI
jgi:hypothetical protein